jgi:hypothetical protein
VTKVLCASGVLRAPRSGASPPRFDSPRCGTVTVRPVRRSAPRPAVEARKADAGVRTPCGGRCRRRSTPQGVRTEHGATTSIRGEGWVTKGEDSWLKGSHGALAIDACPSERRAIDRGLAWCTDKTNRTGAAVYRLGVS